MDRTPIKPEEKLCDRWAALDGIRGDIKFRCEQYAKWTIPSIFPEDYSSTATTEQQYSSDAIGARGLNHLSNRVVTTLFRPQGPFFRLALPIGAYNQIQAATKQGSEELANAVNELEDQLSSKEREAMEQMDMVQYRPSAVYAAGLLICTGNALVFHPPNAPIVVYSLRNYVVQRDISGRVIEMMTRDMKAFSTFNKSVQETLRVGKKHEYEDDTNVTVYTRILLKEDGKYHITQAADDVNLHIGNASYPAKTLPWVVLTWKLQNGEDYGRGLVEDYAGAFHALEVLTQSLVNISAIMGDIKFFVDPASLINIDDVNSSRAGSYHSGKPDQIGTAQMNKYQDAQFIASMIERYEKQISQGFMLLSGAQRDAERVTAEEIRRDANELETSHGGIYSRLAYQWQLPTAYIMLDRIGFDGLDYGIEPKIITGMDTLSRQGELENWAMWVQALAMLESVPEDVRRAINPIKFAQVMGRNVQVNYDAVLYTPAEMQAQVEQENARQAAAVAQQEDAKAAGAVAEEAGKAAVNGEQ